MGFDDEEFDMHERYHPQFLNGTYKDDMIDFHQWNAGQHLPCGGLSTTQDSHRIPDYSEFQWRVRADNTPTMAAYDTEKAWEPLANLFRRLPGLREVIYECPAQFPPCLLQALHDKMPQVTPRLYLRTFKLRMMDDILLAIVRDAAMKKTLRPETLNMDCAYIDNIMRIDPALDLSMLRTLHLLQVHSVSFKDGLSAGSFPLLRDLSLQFVYQDLWRGYDKFKKFIRGFRNLESLRELGWDWPVASFSDWSGEIAPYHTIRSLCFQGSDDDDG